MLMNCVALDYDMSCALLLNSSIATVELPKSLHGDFFQLPVSPLAEMDSKTIPKLKR